MYKLKTYVSLSCRKQLYYSLIYPYLIYCNNVWEGIYSTHLKPLIVLQKRAIRLISDSQFSSHANPLFCQLRILKLCDIYKLKVAVYFFKNNLYNNFVRSHNHNTRSSHNLLPEFQKTNVTQRSINYSVPVLWDELPLDIRSLSTLSQFKRAVKIFYTSRYIDN